MEYDEDKVDEMALALLYLTTFRDKASIRAWKGLAWEVTDRLFQKGYIGDPKGKTKSVIVSEKGARRSEALFRQHFGRATS